MEIESGSAELRDEPPGDGARPMALVQSYRCPRGHVSDIVWTAGEIALARGLCDVTFFCRECGTSQYATEAEARCLLAAFGLEPALRTYSS